MTVDYLNSNVRLFGDKLRGEKLEKLIKGSSESIYLYLLLAETFNLQVPPHFLLTLINATSEQSTVLKPAVPIEPAFYWRCISSVDRCATSFPVAQLCGSSCS